MHYGNLSQDSKKYFFRNSFRNMENQNISLSENCNFSSCFGNLRDSAWDCLSNIQLEPSNQTDLLVQLLDQEKPISQSDRRSYISINFAFAESLLIMIGLFTNLVVSRCSLLLRNISKVQP